jgi:hypothetical protein
MQILTIASGIDFALLPMNHSNPSPKKQKGKNTRSSDKKNNHDHHHRALSWHNRNLCNGHGRFGRKHEGRRMAGIGDIIRLKRPAGTFPVLTRRLTWKKAPAGISSGMTPMGI